MVCWKCICEERLNPQSLYLHFNNSTCKCYNLCFMKYHFQTMRIIDG
jgi:hypothetical protein